MCFPLRSSFALLACASMVLTFGASSLQAADLLLDFGPTANAPTDVTAIRAPYDGDPDYTAASWNVVPNLEPSSLIYSDGTAASGLTFDWGSSGTLAASTVVDFSSLPSSSNALGQQVSQNNFTTDSPARSGVFNTAGGSGLNQTAIGFHLGGLSFGTYDIYIIAINTNASAPMNIWAYSGTNSSSVDVGLLSGGVNITNANATSGFTTTWTEGLNYAKVTVTIDASNPYLTILASGSSSNPTTDKRGFLNSVQVVPVPEPGVVALLALAGVALVFRVRKLRA